jgi:hypothetical protein
MTGSPIQSAITNLQWLLRASVSVVIIRVIGPKPSSPPPAGPPGTALDRMFR